MVHFFVFIVLNDISETGFVENKLHKVDFRALETKFTAVFHVFRTQFTIGFVTASTAHASHTQTATGAFHIYSYRLKSFENKSAILFFVLKTTDVRSLGNPSKVFIISIPPCPIV
jgi:hypothetical protein